MSEEKDFSYYSEVSYVRQVFLDEQKVVYSYIPDTPEGEMVSHTMDIGDETVSKDGHTLEMKSELEKLLDNPEVDIDDGITILRISEENEKVGTINITWLPNVVNGNVLHKSYRPEYTGPSTEGPGAFLACLALSGGNPVIVAICLAAAAAPVP